MIAFWVKVLFFVLSLTGLFSSWIVMYAFGRVVNQQWAPMSYCAGNTILQGIFCLGMIYKMDPYLMPRPFCIAQTIFISIGTYMMTGATGAISVATSLAVLKPKTWGDGGQGLRWHSFYLYPTLVFPVVATIIHTVFVFKFDSVHPSNDLHCDSTRPEWVRFLSYAGVSFIPGLPSLYLSIKSVLLVYKTHQHLLQSHSNSIEGFPQFRSMTEFQIPSRSSRQFHPPLKTSPLREERRESSRISAQEMGTNERDPTISPTFTNSGFGPNLMGEDDRQTELPDRWPADFRDKAGDARPSNSSSILTEVPRVPINYSVRSKEWAADKESDVESSRVDFMMIDGPLSISRSKSRRPPNLVSAMWRIIIFQVAYTTVQLFSSISTVIDVATHRLNPTPFGTQHIALLLAAWGPVVVFGHLPSVVRNLIPWRELRK